MGTQNESTYFISWQLFVHVGRNSGIAPTKIIIIIIIERSVFYRNVTIDHSKQAVIEREVI